MGPLGAFPVFWYDILIRFSKKPMATFLNPSPNPPSGRGIIHVILFLLITISACSESSSNEKITNDTMPVVKPPETVDTSRVITTPPTVDSNVVKPDSSVESR
jgi:hypothetical protein